MDPDPEGDKEGKGGVGGNEKISDAGDAGEKDAAWSFVSFLLFLGEGDEGALASSSLVSLGDDIGSEFISVCTNNY